MDGQHNRCSYLCGVHLQRCVLKRFHKENDCLCVACRYVQLEAENALLNDSLELVASSRNAILERMDWSGTWGARCARLIQERSKLEAENAQLKADIDAYKTTIAGYVKAEELYRLEIKALISVRGQMERGVDIMVTEINQLKAELAEAKARGVRLRALLRDVVQCFCVTQNPDDYPVDSWINKALAELRRLEEVGI